MKIIGRLPMIRATSNDQGDRRSPLQILIESFDTVYYNYKKRNTGDGMAGLVRFGVSLEQELSEVFDKRIHQRGYSNRSEAIRDLIRKDLVDQEWQTGGEVAGAVVLIYDHHKRELLNKITHLQHDFQSVILSAQHVHLDHHHCLEIIAVKGEVKLVRKLADSLKAMKGVKHGALSMSSTGKHLV